MYIMTTNCKKSKYCSFSNRLCHLRWNECKNREICEQRVYGEKKKLNILQNEDFHNAT